MNQKQQSAAVNALRQISNQDTKYEWTNLKSKQDYCTILSKNHQSASQSHKSQSPYIKLPILIKKRNAQDFHQKYLNQYHNNNKQQQFLLRNRSELKHKPKSVRTFFKNQVNPIPKHAQLYPNSTRMQHKYNSIEQIDYQNQNQDAKLKQKSESKGKLIHKYMHKNEKQEEEQMEVIRSWLTKKKLECKSLQIILNKYRDDSGKYSSNTHIFPFKIKTLL